MSTPFGERLRQIRRDQHISMRDLAQRIGRDFTYISKIENGYMEPPSEETITRIFDVLGDIELIYLSGKVPSTLGRMLKDNPRLAELLILLSSQKLSDEIYQKMIALAQEVTR